MNLARRLFDVPLMQNSYRSDYVEEMLISYLRPDGWRHVGGDWAGWDFEHQTGARIEVKQSAALQSWHKQSPKVRTARFDIKARTGYWREGTTWMPTNGRLAHIYIFAWHPVLDTALADHREPNQWEFFVVPETELPPRATVGISRLNRPPKSIGDVASEVEKLRAAVPGERLAL